MRRRSLLASTGALALGALTGCLSQGSGSEPPTDDTTTTPGDDSTATPGDDSTTAPSGNETFDFAPASDEPFATVAVGDRDGVAFPDNNRPHGVAVWNDADERRRIGVTIERDGATPVDRTIAFPAGGYLSVTLNEPGRYAVRIDPPNAAATAVPIDPSWFDCNGSSTKVRVGPGGTVAWYGVSTAMGCPGPAIASRSFSTGDGSCSGEEGVTVTADAGTIEVDGRIKTPDPCHGARLAVSGIADGDLRMEVAATDPESDGACVECVGTVPYTAQFDLDHEYPDRVVVRHRRMDETVTVATESARE